MKKKYSHIIWDWNGTLFDDVQWCIHVVNKMLSDRNLKTLNGIEDYHKAFCFPIIDYYRNIGFDFEKESFEKLAHEYISIYHANKTGNCALHSDALPILQKIKTINIVQVILSASERNNLLSQMNEFDISSYFDDILGISNVYAKSKADIGLNYFENHIVDNALLIGDTVHDYDVSRVLNVDCILIACGHQSKETLLLCNVPVLENISHIIDYVEP